MTTKDSEIFHRGWNVFHPIISTSKNATAKNGTSPAPRRFITRQNVIDETDARSFAAMQQIRKKSHHDASLDERLAERAHEARKQADLLPPGDLRDALLEKARQYEAQISLNTFLSNPDVP